jgi:hypothetical protein
MDENEGRLQEGKRMKHYFVRAPKEQSEKSPNERRKKTEEGRV